MSQLACSECGAPLAGRKGNAVTCSNRCRTKRSQRLRSQHQASQAAAAMNNRSDPATQRMRDAIRHHQDDAIKDAIQEAVTPVVREALTDDTVKAIHDLLALTPLAVAAIEADLIQEDSAERRQKAYTLLMKYTAGHPALMPTVDPQPPAIVVNFPGMPRPDEQVVIEGTAQDVVEEGEPDFICAGCGLQLPDEQRAAPGAPNCGGCFARQQARKTELMRGTT